MLKKTGKQYVHKKSGSCNFFSVDHHGCITSQVRTFFSSGIWDEIDPTCFGNYSVLEAPIDISLHDRGLDMRAYQHSDSGVILLEMNLYDFQNNKEDFSKSAFSAFVDQKQEGISEETYNITAKIDFMLMGLDDCSRWCNGLVFIPKGTKFVCDFNKNFFPKGYRGPEVPVAWPMVCLRNSQIGIEIMFPAKCANDVFEFSKDVRIDLVRRSMEKVKRVKCAKCGKATIVPSEAKNDIWEEYDFAAHAKGRTYIIGEFLCDECYSMLFKCAQKAWFYQTKNEQTPIR